MNIVVIDDDLITLQFCKFHLEQSAHAEDQLFWAESGEEGLKIVQQHPIHLVLTDMIMPGISGLEVIEQTKQWDADIEVIVITAMGSIESAVQAMRLGARDYLTKPLDGTLLVEKVNNVRELYLRRSEAEDYREAKETMEADVRNTITDMELKLALCIELIKEIDELTRGKGPEENLVAQIQQHIQSFYKNVYAEIFSA